jgi:D-glycero-D-manno-heptose 1,7-bisphosphate phosphatase
MQRAFFLDRDGVLNGLVDWGKGTLAAPRNWAEVRILDDFSDPEAVKKRGFLLILATNQPDVVRGITPLTFVEELNEHCRKHFHLDALYICYDSEHSSPMKKPNPGMLLKAAQDFSLSLPESYFLGDTVKDAEAARNAGCKSILWDRPYNQGVRSDFRVSSMRELLDLI